MRSPPETNCPADAALASRHWLNIHLNGGYSGKVRRRHRDNTMRRTVSRCRTRWGRVCQRGPVAERRPLPGVRARLLACDASPGAREQGYIAQRRLNGVTAKRSMRLCGNLRGIETESLLSSPNRSRTLLASTRRRR